MEQQNSHHFSKARHLGVVLSPETQGLARDAVLFLCPLPVLLEDRSHILAAMRSLLEKWQKRWKQDMGRAGSTRSGVPEP